MAGEMNNMMMMETIKFNVGGVMYEVSQSLLSHFPNTMIARAASETWNKSGKNNNNGTNVPIFMDRNGERFAYILDYMRDNKITLPLQNITREGIIDDLNYYGFDNVETIPITSTIPGPGTLNHTKLILNSYNEKLKGIEKILDKEEKKHNNKRQKMDEKYKDQVKERKKEVVL